MNDPEEKITFIRDEAATADFFGSHDPLARTLAQIIREHSDVRLIGLLGPWGSGKSTAIALTQAELEGTDPADGTETIFFVYDAWLSQGDPARRSFIDAFVSFLVAKGIAHESDWKTELDQLRRRSETHDIETSPRLTFWGALVAALLLLLPVGLKLFDVGPRWLAWLIIAGPFLAVAANYLAWRPRASPFKKVFWTKNRRPWENRSVLSLFVNRSVDRVTNRVIKTPDPTSIEFRQVFSSIMERVALEKRRFVFVIDNLDRIPDEDALTVWSTVRSFFADASGGSTRNSSVTSVPWVILPFDPEGIRRLQQHQGVPKDEVLQRTRTFIDKTFDVVLHVGPPITSDWERYLQKKMELVFGTLATEDRVWQATKVYQISSVGGVDRVTPRRINAYLNRLATLWLQWREGVPFPALCYYAAFEDRLQNNISLVLTSEAPGASVARGFDANWQTNVAAVHFGREPGVAVQLLLDPEIEAAVDTGNVKKFAELMDVPGFEGRLDEYTSRMDFSDASLLARAAALVSALPSTSPRVETIWERLTAAAAKSNAWATDDELAASGLEALSKHGGLATQRELVRVLTTATSPFPENIGPDTWATNVATVVKGGGSADAVLNAVAEIVVPGDADFFVKALTSKSVSINERMISALVPKDPQEANGAVLAHLTEGGFSDEAASLLHTLKSTKFTPDWAGIQSAAIEYVRDSSTPGVANALSFVLTQGKSGLNEVKKLGSEGILTDRFQFAHGRGLKPLMATIVIAVSRALPDLTPSAHPGQSQAGMQQLQKLNEAIPDDQRGEFASALLKVAKEVSVEHCTTSLIDMTAKHSSWRSIVSQYLVALAADAALEEMPSATISSKITIWLDLIGDDEAEALVGSVAPRADFWSEVSKASEGVFLKVAKIGLSGDAKATTRAALVEWLARQPSEWWLGKLEGDKETLQTLIGLGPGDHLTLGQPLATAFDGYAAKLLRGEYGYPENREAVAGLLKALSDNAQEVFLSTLRDRFESAEPPHIAMALYVFGGALAASGLLLNDADRNVRHIVMRILALDGEDAKDATEELQRIAPHLAEVVSKARKATREELVSRLAATNTRPDIATLVIGLGLADAVEAEVVKSATEKKGETSDQEDAAKE